MSSQAFVLLLIIHLHFPDSGSLKTKRRDLASVKAQLHTRLGLAVAEVDHQDLWQRSTLVATMPGGSAVVLERTADGIERWLDARFPDCVRVERELLSMEDLRGLG